MANQGYNLEKSKIEEDIMKRDRMDSERNVGALRILPDSIVIDTSERTVDEVLNHILSIIREV